MGETDVDIAFNQSTPNVIGTPDGRMWNMSMLDTIEVEATFMFPILRMLRSLFINLRDGEENVDQVKVQQLAKGLAIFRKGQSQLKASTDGHRCGWEMELVQTGKTLEDHHFRIMETTSQRLHQMGVQDHDTILFPGDP